jgi:hypothetical protein
VGELLPESPLPRGFVYPALFRHIVDLGLTQLEPWWIIDGDLLRDRLDGLRTRYPDRTLIPFAVRQDRDDVACWTGDGEAVAVVHDFASAGYEERDGFDDFASWLRSAVDDLIAFE